MDLEAWSVYVLAAIGLSLTPGPNGLLALSHGLRFGIGRASCTAVGGVVGFLVSDAGGWVTAQTLRAAGGMI